MIEPNSITAFKAKPVSEGPYAEKSVAELEMILRDATQYNDKHTIAAVRSELDTRRGVKAVEAVKLVEKAVKLETKKTPKTSKAKLP